MPHTPRKHSRRRRHDWSSFDELSEVIDATGGDQRLGICWTPSTCGRPEWRSPRPEYADDLVATIDKTIGLERLRCLHLNDSKVAFGANRDRHENIGKGTIGAKGLSALLGNPDLQGLPAILESPGSDRVPGPRIWPGHGSVRPRG